MSHKSEMPYTCAFIEELYRFRTLVPLTVPHKTTEDVTLYGYRIPKGVQVNDLGKVSHVYIQLVIVMHICLKFHLDNS